MTARLARLRIRRGVGDESASSPGRYEEFAVPFEEGATVLDALIWIRAQRDPSLAMRYSCISANVCKECTIAVDGKVVYACTARLEPREMRLEPLPNKARVRDLVTEIAPPDEQLGNIAH